MRSHIVKEETVQICALVLIPDSDYIAVSGSWLNQYSEELGSKTNPIKLWKAISFSSL